METGPGPGARDGEARVQLPIGSENTQRSSNTCAVALRRGLCKAQALGVPARASRDRAGTGASWRLPALPGEESREAEPPPPPTPCSSGSNLPRRRPLRRRHCCLCCADPADRHVLMSLRVSTGRPGPGEAGKGRRLKARTAHLLGA